MKDKRKIINELIFGDDELSGNFETDVIHLTKRYFGWDATKAEFQVSGSIKSLWNIFCENLDELNSKGIQPYIKIKSTLGKKIQRYSDFISEKDPETASILKRRKEIRELILSLDEREFEAFGCYICSISGAIHYALTPRGGDQGIDFCAIVPSEGRSIIFPNQKNTIRILGQSKKWSSGVPVERIRLLRDTCADFLHENYKLRMLLPSWMYTEEGVLSATVFANSGLQSGGTDLAKHLGFSIADLIILVEAVTLHHPHDKSPLSIKNEIKEFIDKLLNEK